MSVIIPGDSVSALGEFLPTPFIDKIIIEGEGAESYFSVTVSVHMPNDSAIGFASNGTVESQKSKYTTSMSELRYYIMISILDEWFQTDYTYAENIALWHDKLRDGTINPIAYALGPGLFYKGYYTASRAGTTYKAPYAHAPGYVIEFLPFDGSITPIETTDEEGNEILKYSVTMDIELDDPYSSGESSYHILHDSTYQADGWNAIYDMDLYAFSSTLDFNEDYESMYNNYIEAVGKNKARDEARHSGSIATYPRLEMKTSGVSYEKVFEQATLADRANVEYLDSESVMYAKTPLISIDSSVHEIDKVTHEQIVEKIQGVLDRYQTYYDTARGFDTLKNMYDGISTIITKYGLDANLLPRLATFQRAWPDKVPAKPVGKMYKDFRKNIFTINKTIKQGKRLYPVVRYSGKVIDARPIADEEPYVPLYDSDWEDHMEEYAYNIKWMTKMDVEEVDDFGTISVVYGAGLFDYEKALAYTSQASKVVNLLKLEAYGLPLPYSMFSIKLISWIREDEDNDEEVRIKSYSGGTIASGGDLDDPDVYDVEYPYTKWVRVANVGAEKRVRRKINDGIPSDETEDDGISDDFYYIIDDEYVQALPGTPYYPNLLQTGVGTFTTMEDATETYDGYYAYGRTETSAGDIYILTKPALLEDGYLTSCTIRPYINPGDDPISETIENYRLIMYDLLDYQRNSTAESYEVQIRINDDTSVVLESLYESFSAAVDLMDEYYALCEETCSFNADTDVFNEFFAENIVSYYEDDIENAPWYRVPFIYCLHRDLHYDSYNGDMDEIKKAATMISARINPIEGTLSGVEALQAAMTEMLAEAYAATSDEYYSALEDLGVNFTTTNTLIYENTVAIPESYSTFEVTAATESDAAVEYDTDYDYEATSDDHASSEAATDTAEEATDGPSTSREERELEATFGGKGTFSTDDIPDELEEI